MYLVRAHREILVFASPFFDAALSGDWSETRVGLDDSSLFSDRRHSISSVITIPQPPSNPRDHTARVVVAAVAAGPSFDPETCPEDAELDAELDVDDLKNELDSLNGRSGTEGETLVNEKDTDTMEKVRGESLSQLEGKKKGSETVQLSSPFKLKKKRPEAKIVLKEEKASIFHDFLKFVYPQ